VRQHGHALAIRPIAQAGSRGDGQALDDGGAECFEEKIFVGFLVAPKALRFRFQFGSGAYGDKYRGVRFSIFQSLE
jgi:hypothetical protein